MPPEPTPPEQWPINNYWREPNKRISQHWYISFCLMMSALQDYLTGLVLQEKNNLSWATTCYYYSMVHTGRLLAFCTIGDYPTRHIDLRNFYQNQQVQFDWLNEFIEGGLTRKNLSWIEPNDFFSATNRLLNGSQTTGGLHEQIGSFSEQLSCLAKLRTDANYESLIIAHEKYHDPVTMGFWRLSDSARLAASNAASLAIRIYRGYVADSSLLENRRQAFKYISNDYVKGRLNVCLKEKIGKSAESRKELSEVCKSLAFRVRDSENLKEEASTIEKQISMVMFGPKTLLMNTFIEKVDRLAAISGVSGVETGKETA